MMTFTPNRMSEQTSALDPVSEGLVDKGWPRPSEDELAGALRGSTAALTDRTHAAEALVRFYNPSGNFAGLTFLAFGPNESRSIEVDDLLATTLLEVTAVPHAVRRLLESRECRDEVTRALSAVRDDVTLADAEVTDLEAAANFYTTIKPYLEDPMAAASNRWVIASKLCARKRPKLIPVRDSVVVAALGLTNRDFRTDWLVFRHLMLNPEVRADLSTVTELAAKKNADIAFVPRLRALDTIIWLCAARTR